MHDSGHGMTSDGASTAGEYSSHSSTPSSYSSPDYRRSSHIGPNSASPYDTRATLSGSSDDSVSSRGRDQLSLYETNIARQLLALKEGIPSDVIAPRRQRQFIDDTRKDAAYWERRRKNNEAAKRSREKRRINDMAMESQISKIQQKMDMMRNELVTLKCHYGLDLDEPFNPSHSMTTDQSVPPSMTGTTHTSPHISLPPPETHHLPLVVNLQHDPIRQLAQMPRSLRPMLHLPLHPTSLQVVPRQLSPNPSHGGNGSPRPPTSCPPSSSDAGKSHWMPESLQRVPTDPGTELAYRHDDLSVERTVDYRSEDDSYYQSDECAYSGRQSSRPDEQDSPLNLVVKAEKPTKETSAELSLRMHVEAARRYEEIKAGSVDHIAEANRESGVISPGGSTSSTSSGSPYSKRLRVDERDSIMESESISENTSSEAVSSRAIDNNKYVERRKRNNEASRRSRENRKYIAKTRLEKTDVLEMENSKLRQELNSLASEVSSLKQLIGVKHGRGLESADSDAQRTRDVPVSVPGNTG